MLGSFLGKQTWFSLNFCEALSKELRQRRWEGKRRLVRVPSQAKPTLQQSSGRPPIVQCLCVLFSDCYSRREFMYGGDGAIHLCVFIFWLRVVARVGIFCCSYILSTSAHARNSIFQNAGGTCSFVCVLLQLNCSSKIRSTDRSRPSPKSRLTLPRSVSARSLDGDPAGWITPQQRLFLLLFCKTYARI